MVRSPVVGSGVARDVVVIICIKSYARAADRICRRRALATYTTSENLVVAECMFQKIVSGTGDPSWVSRGRFR
jgi:hypothetical protein